MSFSAPDRHRLGIAFPLTSMVDIMFLLLVFFMTTGILREQHTLIDVVTPGQQSPSAAPSPTPIVISITADGQIYLADAAYSLDELRAKLAELARSFPNETLVVRADRDSRWGLGITVLDLARAAGMRNASIATTKAPEDL